MQKCPDLAIQSTPVDLKTQGTRKFAQIGEFPNYQTDFVRFTALKNFFEQENV